MLKEQVEILDIAEADVLNLSQAKSNLKTKYQSTKKDLKQLLKTNQINKTTYQVQLSKLTDAYKFEQLVLKKETNYAITYLVNKYEYFNDFKANPNNQQELSSTRQFALQKIDDELKFETDKTKRHQLQTQKKEAKALYSKTIKNKVYLYGGLAIILGIILTSLLIIYLFINKKHNDNWNWSETNTIITFVMAMICLTMILVYIGFLVIREHKKWALDRHKGTLSTFLHSIWSFILNSFGVGVFATFTTVFKKNGLFNDDKKMVGTLNTGCMVGGMFGGILTLQVIKIEMSTLIPLVLMCLIGSYFGAKLVQKINRKVLTLTMSILLIIATILMFISMPEFHIINNGTKIGLAHKETTWQFILALILFIGFGMLISFGVGIYAPVMVFVKLIGMDFTVAAPLMMLCAGFSGQVNCYLAMKKNMYLPKTAYTMLIGSIVGDFIYFIVMWVGVYTIGGVDKKVISEVFQWISIPVIGYSAYLLFKSYLNLRKAPAKVAPIQTHLTKADLSQVKFIDWLDVMPTESINYKIENRKLNYTKVHW